MRGPSSTTTRPTSRACLCFRSKKKRCRRARDARPDAAADVSLVRSLAHDAPRQPKTPNQNSLQPVKETREKQSALWCALIHSYCRHHRVRLLLFFLVPLDPTPACPPLAPLPLTPRLRTRPLLHKTTPTTGVHPDGWRGHADFSQRRHQP